ncbi:MAG: hypothetical protein JWN01_506 [Patescibacteria group bacterium]|nr:hypothetical protein [Patescibacteria group bacterium]
MYWANLLHFYQPYGQKREIVDAIVAQCYRPVGEGILAHPEARLTINFTGVLLDQLAAYGYQDVIDLYAEAARRGQVEFVGSGKYHAILPLLPVAEARRQIEINNDTNRHFFGDAYQPRGIFLPEMAWDPKLAPVLEAAGFDWVMLDELAATGRIGDADYTKMHQITGTKLKALFREHRLSSMVASVARDVEHLKDAARDELSQRRYIVTGMDGEVFGHHQIGHQELLFAMFKDPDIKLVRMSDLFEKFTELTQVKTVACTWASSEDDIAKNIQFISWQDPENDIHKLQWELLNLTIEQLEQLPKSDPDYPRLRGQLDQAIASDQFYWAAARPWWMIEHIERGAFDLLTILQHQPNSGPLVRERGLNLYQQILAMAYKWQRSGKIDRRDDNPRVPFKELSLERGDHGTWHAFVDMMRHEEQDAAGRRDYEEAILWRNGIYKLEHKLDIYDSLYVLDLLHKRLPRGEVEETISQYKAKYNSIRGGQVEQRSN